MSRLANSCKQAVGPFQGRYADMFVRVTGKKRGRARKVSPKS